VIVWHSADYTTHVSVVSKLCRAVYNYILA